MGLIKVRLTDYPDFWRDFAAKGSAFDPSAIVTSEQFERWAWEWYGIQLRAIPGESIGNVYMEAAEYTAFALKWNKK